MPQPLKLCGTTTTRLKHCYHGTGVQGLPRSRSFWHASGHYRAQKLRALCFHVAGLEDLKIPKGPCAQIVYTEYFKAKVYTIWVGDDCAELEGSVCPVQGLGRQLPAKSSIWCLVGNGGMDPCSSTYILSNSSLHNLFPHSPLRPRTGQS